MVNNETICSASQYRVSVPLVKQLANSVAWSTQKERNKRVTVIDRHLGANFVAQSTQPLSQRTDPLQQWHTRSRANPVTLAQSTQPLPCHARRPFQTMNIHDASLLLFTRWWHLAIMYFFFPPKRKTQTDLNGFSNLLTHTSQAASES